MRFKHLRRPIQAVLLIPLVVAGIAGLFAGGGSHAASSSSHSAAAYAPDVAWSPQGPGAVHPTEYTEWIYLPLVMAPPAPFEFTLAIYDLDGQEQDWDWVVETFGAVTLDRGTGAATVTVLRAIEGPMALVVHVENPEGDPLEGIPVMFWWPDAPELPPEEWACGLDRGLLHHTKDTGDAEFIMGGGAWYYPPGGGPHAAWVVAEGTDCLGGLGWLGETNHIHLNSEWTLN